MGALDVCQRMLVHRFVRPIVTTQPSGLPGWYGKLPSLGDFASRRLTPEWIEAWDAWLAAGLQGWRERDGDHWLENYLQGPSLRFLVMTGVMPAGTCAAPEPGQSWAGVLMPSVDRSGRYFPLTLAQPLSHLPANANALDQLLNWRVQLDDLAVAALQDNWTPDQLEAQLHALEALPVPDAVAPTAPFTQFATGTHGAPTSLLWALARTPLLQSLHEKVLWWCDGAPGQQLLRITAGLPKAEDFSGLLTTPFGTTTTQRKTLQYLSTPGGYCKLPTLGDFEARLEVISGSAINPLRMRAVQTFCRPNTLSFINFFTPMEISYAKYQAQ